MRAFSVCHNFDSLSIRFFKVVTCTIRARLERSTKKKLIFIRISNRSCDSLLTRVIKKFHNGVDFSETVNPLSYKRRRIETLLTYKIM